MGWGHDWAWGLPIVVLTVVVHVGVLVLVTSALVRALPRQRSAGTPVRFSVAIAVTALGAAALHGLEAAIWALLYLGLGAVPDWRTAMLYSLGAITSYGHANVDLADRWRVLGTIESLNGVILFGLTTAFLFAAIQEVRPVRRG